MAAIYDAIEFQRDEVLELQIWQLRYGKEQKAHIDIRQEKINKLVERQQKLDKTFEELGNASDEERKHFVKSFERFYEKHYTASKDASQLINPKHDLTQEKLIYIGEQIEQKRENAKLKREEIFKEQFVTGKAVETDQSISGQMKENSHDTLTPEQKEKQNQLRDKFNQRFNQSIRDKANENARDIDHER